MHSGLWCVFSLISHIAVRRLEKHTTQVMPDTLGGVISAICDAICGNDWMWLGPSVESDETVNQYIRAVYRVCVSRCELWVSGIINKINIFISYS